MTTIHNPARGMRVAEAKSSGGALQQFSTPRWVVDRLLERLVLGGSILEPFAGQGAIIRAVESRRPFGSSCVAQWTAWEIDEEWGRPLFTAPTGVAMHVYPRLGDFFDLGPELAAEGKRWPFDIVLTNPPFKRAAEALPILQQLAPLVIMLLRVGWFGSAARRDALAGNMPERALMLPDRISFDGDGSPSDYHAWMVWTTRRCARTELELLNLTPLEERKAPVNWWEADAPPKAHT